MRVLLLVSIFLVPLFGFSEEIPRGKGILIQNYSIVSDTKKSDVPLSKCRIIGNVRNGQSNIRGAIVSTLDRTKVGETDSLGNYEFYVSVGDTSIFCFAKGFSEIVLWDYEFKGGHEVVINFFPYEDQMIQVVDKPVIYMYSESTIKASVEIGFGGDLTFTYPKYNNGWRVGVSESGITHQGRSYPYLFWEGETRHLAYQSNEGFVIKTDTVVTFLERMLGRMSFNDKEKTDFITFWAPRMVTKDYAFVQFVVDENYSEQIATIALSPEPDNLKRVFMMFSLSNENLAYLHPEEQVVEPFNRGGFTVLEWGGSEISDLIDLISFQGKQKLEEH
jgi:hypothetical protein